MVNGASKPGGCLDRVALWALAFGLALCIVLAWTGGTASARLIGALVVVGVSAGLLRGALRLGGPTAWRVVGWSGAGASGGAGLLALVMIWRPEFAEAGPPGVYLPLRICVALAACAALIADLGRLHVVQLRRMVDRLVRGTAAVTAGLLAAMVVVGCLFDEPDVWLRSLFRTPMLLPWIGFASLLTFTHLATPILGRLEERRERERLAQAPDRALLTLQCPRCSLWMQMNSGRIACPGCHLPITIEFEEPRCACGYALHRLGGACCPECGRAIPPDQRWGRGAASESGVAGSAHRGAVEAPVRVDAPPVSPEGLAGPPAGVG